MSAAKIILHNTSCLHIVNSPQMLAIIIVINIKQGSDISSVVE